MFQHTSTQNKIRFPKMIRHTAVLYFGSGQSISCSVNDAFVICNNYTKSVRGGVSK